LLYSCSYVSVRMHIPGKIAHLSLQSVTYFTGIGFVRIGKGHTLYPSRWKIPSSTGIAHMVNGKMKVMNTRLKRLALSVLMVTGFTLAHADPTEGEVGREMGIAAPVQVQEVRNDWQAEKARYQEQPMVREERGTGRLTSEQKKALRRQIDEAGQDIYHRRQR